MGKGFDQFMENPYWRGVYEGAPSEDLREYYRIVFDIRSFVPCAPSEVEEGQARLEGLWLDQADVRYLLDHAGMNQARAFYRKCLDKLADAPEGTCIKATAFQGEIRNPDYAPRSNQEE